MMLSIFYFLKGIESADIAIQLWGKENIARFIIDYEAVDEFFAITFTVFSCSFDRLCGDIYMN